MAGHSKWANIRFRKAAQDAKRGQAFTKLIKEITLSARAGGDPASNARLRSAIDKALAANMTRDTINRAVRRGSGAEDGAALEEIRYEGYAPGGVAVLVECATDNRNRTVSGVRHAFSKYGGNLGTDGSVAYLFEPVGLLLYDETAPADTIMDLALEAGAKDLDQDEWLEIITEAGDFAKVVDALTDAGHPPKQAELLQRPLSEIELDTEQAQTVQALIETLEALDDVQNVYSNAQFPQAPE